MSSLSVISTTPSHVLLEDNHRIGPCIQPSAPNAPPCKAIYGFSNKACFDQFCFNSELTLIPYPLVSGYLQNQIEEAGDGLMLVVLDAKGPSDPILYAATMEAVLSAMRDRMPHVTAQHTLEVDLQNKLYRLAGASSA